MLLYGALPTSGQVDPVSVIRPIIGINAFTAQVSVFPVADYRTVQVEKNITGAKRSFTLDVLFRLCFPAVSDGGYIPLSRSGTVLYCPTCFHGKYVYIAKTRKFSDNGMTQPTRSGNR